ncbi:MAG: amidohydrolase [Bdellovibrionaceae bacterium]|nr:amidohydrolase [Pseudobdellovibrionaceae bacterium]
MPKIDTHTHILPPEIPKFKDRFGYGGFIQLVKKAGCSHCDMVDDRGQFFRRVESNVFTAEDRMKDMRAQAVNVQVISTVPVMFSYWAKPGDGLVVAQFLNDHVAEVCGRYPKKFIGLGTLPLQDIDLSIREAQRAMVDLKLAGFQIGSHIMGKNLSDVSLYPLYEELEKLGASVFVHPWDMMGQEQMPEYWLPWLVGMPAETSRAICSFIFGGIFDRFPKLRVQFAHGGGSFPFTLGRIQHGYESRPDLCAVDCKLSPKEYVSKFYVDSLVHDQRSLKFLLEVMSEDHICLGTDYPFPLGELEAGRLIDDSGFIDKSMREKLFHRNALKWLNRNQNDFL